VKPFHPNRRNWVSPPKRETGEKIGETVSPDRRKAISPDGEELVKPFHLPTWPISTDSWE